MPHIGTDALPVQTTVIAQPEFTDNGAGPDPIGVVHGGVQEGGRRGWRDQLPGVVVMGNFRRF